MSILDLHARQIFDSRGNPTLEVDLTTAKGVFRASVPSGASTGKHEAHELRDNVETEYKGKGVYKAVANVNNKIKKKLIGQGFRCSEQKRIDKFLIELDGTFKKHNLGANAILGVSMAACKAGAAEKDIPLYQHIALLADNTDIVLPVPAFNVINGGSHAGNRIAIQEFMILPTNADSFTEAMKMGSEVYHSLKKVITAKYGSAATAVGDEGGFAPNIENISDAFDLIMAAIDSAGYTGRFHIALDVAASEFFKLPEHRYDLDFKNPQTEAKRQLWKTPNQLLLSYEEWMKEYPLISIEDPFDQDDWDSWPKLCEKPHVQIVGDDLTVTNLKRIYEARDKNACNCLLLKVNQIGTVTEAIRAHKLAKKSGWGTMVSHRSGETEDSFIADLVVGIGAGQIKTGAPCRSERLAKYNQLLRIEEELNKCGSAKYAGKNYIAETPIDKPAVKEDLEFDPEFAKILLKDDP